ncbi:hypothetical protein M758_4G073100 [Ceratodon purpureus]|uniref:Uncharacterized protein n=1 Tax=Ceratodon purpureus TaxID=3225 RepID=A0A8T0I8R7_CERPU|nr:hypothetical protein KC19_4G072300 [Ceratodon purpureus]KAG0618554.1 hypothetical protein M758_4G073100 [Ceratodon purpureus]
MADTNVIREENPGLFPRNTKQGWEDHAHQQNLKKGIERLDRRSANPNKGAVKKQGHGGKFTMDGPYNEEDYADPVPAAMDENDPNFVDPLEEQADRDAGISSVEVAKVEATGAGTAHPA